MLFRPPPQDANVFVSENDPGTRFDVALGAGRQAYVVCIEGEAGAGAGTQRGRRTLCAGAWTA